jgi:hypothetical protein
MSFPTTPDPSAPLPTGTPVPTAPSVSALRDYAVAQSQINDTLENRLTLAKTVGDVEVKFAKEVNELLQERRDIENAYKIEATNSRAKLNEALKVYTAALEEASKTDAQLQAESAEAIRKLATATGERAAAQLELDALRTRGFTEAEENAAKEKLREKEQKVAAALAESNAKADIGNRRTALESIRDLAKEEAERAAADYAAKQRRAKQEAEYTAAETNLSKVVEKLGDGLFRTAKLSESVGGSLVLAFQQAREEGLKVSDALMSVTKRLGDMIATQFSLERIVGGFLKGIQEATVGAIFQLDDLQAAFNKTTGSGEEMMKVVGGEGFKGGANTGLSQLGISRADTAKAFSDLFTNYNKFTKLNTDQQRELTATTAKFEKLGIETSKYAKILDILTNTSMKKTEEQVKKITEDFVKLAKTIGMSTGQIATDFEKNADKFIVYGDVGVKVFENLEKTVKATGLSMESLLGIAAKFDTFESAAQTTAQLNLLFRGQASAMDLVGMKEDERILAIKRMMDASGQQFSTMDKWQKQNLAQIVGLKSVTEAEKYFTKSTSDLTTALKQQADQTKDLNDIMEKSTTAKQKLSLMMEQMAIVAEPLLVALQGLVSVLAWIADNPVGRWFLFAIGAVVVLGASVIALTATFMGAINAFRNAALAIRVIRAAVMAAAHAEGVLARITAARTAASTALARAEAARAAATGGTVAPTLSAGAAAGASAAQMLAFGFAVLMVGAGIALALSPLVAIAYILYKVIVTLKDLPPQRILALAGAMAVFGLVIIGLAYALTATLPALAAASTGLGIFFGVMMMGVGVFLFTLFALAEYKKRTAETTLAQAKLNDSITAMNTSFDKLGDGTKLDVINSKFKDLKATLSDFSIDSDLMDLVNSDGLNGLARISGTSSTSSELLTKTASVSTDINTSMTSVVSTMASLDTSMQNSILFRAERNPFKMLKDMIDGTTSALGELNVQFANLEGSSVAVEVAQVYTATADAFNAIRGTSTEQINKSTEFVKATRELATTKVSADREKIIEIISAVTKVDSGNKQLASASKETHPPLIFNIDVTKLKEQFVFDSHQGLIRGRA